MLIACDTVSTTRRPVEETRAAISKRFGIPAANILISATHCHTGPVLTEEYEQMLGRRMIDAVVTASGRKRPARLFAAVEQEPSLPFYRRFFMRNGTVRTNPGFLNPDVVKPAGPIDPRVGVLYAEDAQG